MILWNMVRMCFLWMPTPLFLLCSVVFAAFTFMLVLKILRTIWDALPFL